MPRFPLKTASMFTLTALIAYSGPLDCSDSSTESLHGAPDSALPATAVAEESLSLAENTKHYQDRPGRPVKSVTQELVSAFSIDIDTGSYASVRRFLNSGKQPPKDAIHTEEIINYFPYNYPLPTDGCSFAVHTETINSPWQPETKLIKIGVQARDTAGKNLSPTNLMFLAGISGSMDEENKLPLVQETLRILTQQLRPQDRVTLITYSSDGELVLPPTLGSDKETILRAIDELKVEDSTSDESALRMTYKETQEALVPNGINRVLLTTDDDFNVDVSDTGTLKSMVAEGRKTGISLNTLGFGTGGYNEDVVEQIADAGDGSYSYIDNEEEAKKVLQRQLTSTLATVAQGVKIQIKSNPVTVKEYHSVGYTNRILRNEDFNNDKVDAGGIGSGHSVTAIYEIIPAGKTSWLDKSRYQKVPAAKGSESEYTLVKVRYKLPGEKDSKLMEQAIPVGSKPLEQADKDTLPVLAAAFYAQALHSSEYNGRLGRSDIEKMVQQVQGDGPFELKSEFLQLIHIAAGNEKQSGPLVKEQNLKKTV